MSLKKNFLSISLILNGLIPKSFKPISESQSSISQSLSSLEIIKSSFFPLVDMSKDFRNTARPYRSRKDIFDDFLQPVYGLGNVLKGALYLIGFIPASIILGLMMLYKTKNSVLPM